MEGKVVWERVADGWLGPGAGIEGGSGTRSGGEEIRRCGAERSGGRGGESIGSIGIEAGKGKKEELSTKLK